MSSDERYLPRKVKTLAHVPAKQPLPYGTRTQLPAGHCCFPLFSAPRCICSTPAPWAMPNWKS